jgi:uncharacterized protein YkwD
MNEKRFMIRKSLKSAILILVKVFLGVASLGLLVSIYFFGFLEGYKMGSTDMQSNYESVFDSIISQYKSAIEKYSQVPTPTKTVVKPTVTPSSINVSWGGPELWDAVNERRVLLGVNPLSTRSELCTIASIRLNELLDLGKLDNHEGFSNMDTRRPDLKWIFDKYGTLSEFLAMGGSTPQETVSMWENTLGHSKLLKGGEFVWGCIYAQNTFAVAITAF